MSKISTVSKLLLSTGLITVAGASASFAQSAWDGFYGGVSFGSSFGDTGGQYPPFQFESSNGAAFVGFNQSFGSYVVGAEIEAYLGSVTSEADEINMSNLVDVKARVGMTYGNALMYFSAGMSGGSMNFSCPGCDYGVSGMNYGIGVDYAVTDSMFVGVNYTVRDMGDAGDYAIDTSNFSTVSIRAGYKF